jgi:hypothetical protein
VASRWAGASTLPDPDLAWAAGDHSMFVAFVCRVTDASPAPQRRSSCALNLHARLLDVSPPTSARAMQAPRRLLLSAIMLSSPTARTPCAIASAALFELDGRATWMHSIFRHTSCRLQQSLRTSRQLQPRPSQARLTKSYFQNMPCAYCGNALALQAYSKASHICNSHDVHSFHPSV